MENPDIGKREEKVRGVLFNWITDNYDKTFLMILTAAFLIRLWIFFKTMNQPIWWDAGDYLSTAKRFGLGLDIRDTWYYRRGFFWPFFSAIFFKIGLGEVGLRLSEVLFSTGIIAASYFLIKDMFNKKLALLTSLGLSLSWIFLFFTARPLTSIPATFFLLTSLLFFWKGYVLKKGNKFIYLFGAFFALAILTRMQYLMFVPVFLIFFFVKEKFRFIRNKQLWITLGIFGLIITPQVILHAQHYGNPLIDLLTYHLGIEQLSGVSETGEVAGVGGFKTIFVYIKNIPYILDGNQAGYSSLFVLSPIYFLFIIGFFYFFIDLFLGFDKIFKDEIVQKKFFVFLWVAFALMFLGYIAPHLEQRYMMQTLPFLFLIAFSPFVILESFLIKKYKLKEFTIILIILIILSLLLIPNIKFGNSLIEVKKTSYLEVKQAGVWLKENSNPEDIIMSDSQPQVQYYSERDTYTFSRNLSDFEQQIQELNPRFLMISIFEPYPQWTYNYPQENADKWIPAKVYEKDNQPVLIIYESNIRQ
ncbi:MAG: glycosyltransferase family 39 protein [Candidatus Pacearchaeota archaeon]|mgnify:FL=1|jgi:hypothetical protein|nr:hypothetical protein [Candidatus Pacearchaeota archaeon]MDP7520914.1 glycosyltransferase family 39 protein [Candidatus Pacearchaeota archaeon]|tara:strand:- start:1029 stop:2618 length:1590 start_codon:yes stop_codon:yes gene_type:complete